MPLRLRDSAGRRSPGRRATEVILVREDHTTGAQPVNCLAGVSVYWSGFRTGPGIGQRLLLNATPQSRWRQAGVAHVEPPQHAVGRNGALGRGRGIGWWHRRRRLVAGRPGGVYLPTRMGAERQPVSRLGPQRLVEPLPLGSARGPDHAALSSGGRVRTAAVAVRGVHLWLLLGSGAGSGLHSERADIPDQPGYPFASDASNRASVYRDPDPARRWCLGREGNPRPRFVHSRIADHPNQAGPARSRVGTARRLFDGAVPSPSTPHGSPWPEPVEFPTDGGKTGAQFLYPPEPGLRCASWRTAAPPGDEPRRPERLHLAHPALRRPVLDQPGIAVLDVDYGGSTGYGRAYRER